MERNRPLSNPLLVNLPRASVQYWEGQVAALNFCLTVLDKMEPEQAKKIIAAKLNCSQSKLGDKPNG